VDYTRGRGHVLPMGVQRVMAQALISITQPDSSTSKFHRNAGSHNVVKSPTISFDYPFIEVLRLFPSAYDFTIGTKHQILYYYNPAITVSSPL
jgi:hypothetical protein